MTGGEVINPITRISAPQRVQVSGAVVQETRLYDAERDVTRPMRSKEEANDYRYFPDPDLLLLTIEANVIESLRAHLPELPDEKRARFEREFGLSAYDANVLSTARELADFFEDVVAGLGAAHAKLAANWVMGEWTGALNREQLEPGDARVSAAALAGLLARVADNTISGKIAKQVFEAMWAGEGTADEIIAGRSLRQITDSSALDALVDEAIAAHPAQLEQFRAGKEKLFGFFVGQVMKASGGKANPAQVNEILKKKLDAAR